MASVARILAHTPAWVFALLVYFIWQGVLSLKPRTLPYWRVLLVPGLFIAMGLSRIVLSHEAGAVSYLTWLGGAVLFAPLAFVTGPRLLAIDRGKGQVTRAGSPVPLIRNVGVFSVQYGVATAAAMDLHGHEALSMLGHAVSGAEAGYFTAWGGLFIRRYGRHP